MSSKRFNAKNDGTVRVIHLRTGAPKHGVRSLTATEVRRLRLLLQERLTTLKATSGTIVYAGVAMSGSAWITLMSGSLPPRTCMDMSAFAAGALAVMLAVPKGAAS